MRRFTNILITLFLVVSNSIHAQKFDWAKSFGVKNSTERIVSVIDEKNGYFTFIFSITDAIPNSPQDTLFLDTFSIIIPSTSNTAKESIGSYIIRTDSLGHIIKVLHLGSFIANNASTDKDGNIYFSATLKDTNKISILGNAVSVNTNFSPTFYFKLNRNLQLIWVKQYGNTQTQPLGATDLKNLIITGNEIHILLKIKGTTTIGDSLYFNTNYTSLIVEINPVNGSVLWSKPYFVNSSIPIVGLVKLKNFIFCSAWNRSNSVLYYYSDSIPKGACFILKLDTIGRIVSVFKVFSKKGFTTTFSNITSDGENLYIAGGITDTTCFNSIVVSPQFPSGSGKMESFILSLSDNFILNWLKIPRIMNIKSSKGGYIRKIQFENEFLYLSGYIVAETDFNSILIKQQSYPAMLILKMDKIGNTLWASSGGDGTVFDFETKRPRMVLISGSFNSDTLTLDSFKLIKKRTIGGHLPDAFITKLSDNAIIRGQVKAGPYCAGDTLRIPYRKIGDYDTSNVFIAELSDADGNFTGGHRQLGRLKSNKDSVILARLPLFQVGSSEKYRIRILSTAPAVQSYYKVDTLRLLIYSKDKAYAGNDTTICKGDSVLLQTYGGTKWSWSPSYKLKDSTARRTPAWPDKTTRYKIIIADSSGCGMADTAFKTIVVRKEPSIQFHTPKDTGVCIGGRMPLIASFHGGDSLGYSWQWASIDGLGNYSFPRSGSGKLADTLVYSMPVNELDSMRFVLYLNDGCTPKTAFYNYTLKVKKQKSRAKFNGSDTMVCPGKAIAVVAGFDAGDYSLYSWTWQEQNLSGSWNNRRFGSNKGTDTFMYTLSPLWQGKKKLRVLLKDQCTGLSDTAVYSLIPRDTLSLSLNSSDTTLCQGSQYVFKVKAKGGNPSTYQYKWINTNNQDTLSLTDSLPYKPKTSVALMVEVSDGCMQRSIQKTIQVYVFPVLSAGIYSQSKKAKDSTLCYGQVLKVYAQSSGGKGSGYNYLWKYNGVNIGQKDSMAFTSFQSAVLELISSDGCSVNDSTSININVLPKLESNIKTQDSLCLPSTLSLKALAKGGKGNYSYQWLSSSNVLLGTKDSLQISYNDSSQKGLRVYKLILQDGCSSNDSTKINLHLLPLLPPPPRPQGTRPARVRQGDGQNESAAERGGSLPRRERQQ